MKLAMRPILIQLSRTLTFLDEGSETVFLEITNSDAFDSVGVEFLSAHEAAKSPTSALCGVPDVIQW